MQLNSIVFPAPICSYTTEKLFKDLIYIPKKNYGQGEAESIPCLYLPYEVETKILLFFHGNAEDIGIAYDVLTEMKNCLKLTIFAMEYPGYGLYFGQTNADKLLKDSLHVYDHLTQVLGVDENDIIVFGRSIGSSPACYVAQQRSPAALILMSPFKSIRETAKDLVGRFLSMAIAERFRNIDVIKQVRCPIHIIHGQKDKLIPYSHSQDLYDSCFNAIYAKLTLPPKMDHNDFDFDDDFIDPLCEFFKQISLITEDVRRGFSGISLHDDYYFPTPNIITYEKTLVKSSIIWEIIEDRKRQDQIRKLKQEIEHNHPNIAKTDASIIAKQYNGDSQNFDKENQYDSFKRERTSLQERIELLKQQELVFNTNPNLQQQVTSTKSSEQRIRVNIKEQYNRKSLGPMNDDSGRKSTINEELKNKMNKLLNDDGYEWNQTQTVGVRQTETKTSLKFM